MDFKDTPEQAAFRAEVRQWLTANARPKQTDAGRPSQAERYEDAKRWYKNVAEAGFACLDWPKEYGGAGLSQIHKVIWSQEVANYAEPDGYFVIGIGNCGPAIMHFASEQQKQHLLPRMASAEDVWCQMFSEPSAGSDVAGLRTSAVKQGDKWVVNGQKIWTSGAQHSDYGVILCRTDTEVSKYRGMTMFYIDMHQPGVDVKPIKQMDGDAHFNEVFFNDVRIPDSQRIGAEGDGWKVSLTTLMNERLAVGDPPGLDFDQIFEASKEIEVEDGLAVKNSEVRQKMADWYIQSRGLQYTKYRSMTALSKGQTPGPELSISKLVTASKMQDVSSYALDLMDMSGMVHQDQNPILKNLFQNGYFFSAAMRIAGGTDEVLRNIIAERVLGLPQDERSDKKLPFNELPSGKN